MVAPLPCTPPSRLCTMDWVTHTCKPIIPFTPAIHLLHCAHRDPVLVLLYICHLPANYSSPPPRPYRSPSSIWVILLHDGSLSSSPEVRSGHKRLSNPPPVRHGNIPWTLEFPLLANVCTPPPLTGPPQPGRDLRAFWARGRPLRHGSSIVRLVHDTRCYYWPSPLLANKSPKAAPTFKPKRCLQPSN